MCSSKVALSIVSPGAAKAHSLLRANLTTGPLLPAARSARGCSMSAEAKTCAAAPPAISSLSRPEGPNFATTVLPHTLA
jgi:hypothetical protein